MVISTVTLLALLIKIFVLVQLTNGDVCSCTKVSLLVLSETGGFPIAMHTLLSTHNG